MFVLVHCRKAKLVCAAYTIIVFEKYHIWWKFQSDHCLGFQEHMFDDVTKTEQTNNTARHIPFKLFLLFLMLKHWKIYTNWMMCCFMWNQTQGLNRNHGFVALHYHWSCDHCYLGNCSNSTANNTYFVGSWCMDLHNPACMAYNQAFVAIANQN